MSGDDQQVFRRNVRWQIVGSFGPMVLSVLVLMVMARGLGAQGFGVFSVIMSLVLVANALFEPRMQDVAARRFWDLSSKDKENDRHDKAAISLFLLEALGKLLPVLGLAALAKVLADVGNLPPGGAWLIALAAGGYYVSKLGFGLSVGLLRVIGRSDLYAYCVTGEVFVRLVLLIILYFASAMSVETAILAQSVSGALSIAAQWALVSRYAVDIRRAVRAWSSARTLELLKRDRRLLLSNIGLSMSDLMTKDLDVTLISPLVPATQVGLYKMAKNIVMLAWKGIDPFYLALMPEVNRLVSLREFGRVKSLLAKSAIGLFAISFTLGAGAYVGVTLFGAAVFGPGFAALPQLLPYMFVGVVLSAPLVWGHPLAVALDRADLALIGSVLGSLAGIAVFLWLVPTYGILGAGIGWTTTFIVNFGFTSTLSLRQLRRHRARIGSEKLA